MRDSVERDQRKQLTRYTRAGSTCFRVQSICASRLAQGELCRRGAPLSVACAPADWRMGSCPRCVRHFL
jgi:hypothetical protein